MTDIAYKLLDRAEWLAARQAGVYAGSPVDLADGFIHLSSAEQLVETVRKHFPGRTDLLLLTVDLTRAGDVRWEPSRGGALFPHIYGPMAVEAVTTERPLSVDADGVMQFEDGAHAWPA